MLGIVFGDVDQAGAGFASAGRGGAQWVGGLSLPSANVDPSCGLGGRLPFRACVCACACVRACICACGWVHACIRSRECVRAAVCVCVGGWVSVVFVYALAPVCVYLGLCLYAPLSLRNALSLKGGVRASGWNRRFGGGSNRFDGPSPHPSAPPLAACRNRARVLPFVNEVHLCEVCLKRETLSMSILPQETQGEDLAHKAT